MNSLEIEMTQEDTDTKTVFPQSHIRTTSTYLLKKQHTIMKKDPNLIKQSYTIKILLLLLRGETKLFPFIKFVLILSRTF